MQKWEYALLSWWAGLEGIKGQVEFTDQPAWELTTDDELIATLKRLGEDGWEMVGTDVINQQYVHNPLYFKRPKP